MGHKVRRPPRLKFPLIVKSLIEHASIGIARASVVDSDEKLAERVTFVHDRIGTDAIAEQFIEGRELYVSLIGNDRLVVFPIWELVAEKRPEGEPLIATARVKHDVEYQLRHGIDTRAALLPDDLAANWSTPPSASTRFWSSPDTRDSTSGSTQTVSFSFLKRIPIRRSLSAKSLHRPHWLPACRTQTSCSGS